MHKTIEQEAIDTKISRFLSRKAPWKTSGKVLSEHLASPHKTNSSDSDISYEPLEWHHNEMVRGTTWQKAH